MWTSRQWAGGGQQSAFTCTGFSKAGEDNTLHSQGKENGGNYLISRKEDGVMLDVRKNFLPACKEKAFFIRYN